MKDFQITWKGIVHDSQGYAQASREYILGLDKIGVDVRVEPLNFGTPPVQLSTEKTKRLRELIAKPLAENKTKVLIYHAQPYGIDPRAEKHAKGYDYAICNTVWETDRIPESWFPSVNQFDAIFVPSKENIIALRNSGVDVPIFLVPHGADTEYYNPNNEKLDLQPVKDVFTFLSVFKWEHRKAPEILLDAYWQEFNSQDNVALIIKSYWGDGRKKSDQRTVRDRINHYKQIKGYTDTAPIYYTGSLFTDNDMKGLYTLSDVFVLPTRGEGVGLPYIEALSSGIPVIATNWGGQTDFINEDNGYLVDYEMEAPSKSFESSIAPHFNQIFTDNMKWAKPSAESLKKRMREAYENKDVTRAKGLIGRQDMELMSWEKSAHDLVSHLEYII